MKVAYTAHATATGGREGHSRTDDGKVDVNLAPPKELGGSGTGVNPEQLFAAGYAACYLGAIKFAAHVTTPSSGPGTEPRRVYAS